MANFPCRDVSDSTRGSSKTAGIRPIGSQLPRSLSICILLLLLLAFLLPSVARADNREWLNRDIDAYNISMRQYDDETVRLGASRESYEQTEAEFAKLKSAGYQQVQYAKDAYYECRHARSYDRRHECNPLEREMDQREIYEAAHAQQNEARLVLMAQARDAWVEIHSRQETDLKKRHEVLMERAAALAGHPAKKKYLKYSR